MRQLKITKRITNRDSASLEKYLEEIKRDDFISYEEEIELAKLTRQGDVEALKKLVQVNRRYVVSIAKQYQNQGVDMETLIYEGNLGLLRAAENFDENGRVRILFHTLHIGLEKQCCKHWQSNLCHSPKLNNRQGQFF